MKIAFYTDTYLPNVDGVVSQIVASKKELEKRRHYVQVFTPGTRLQKKANKDKTVSYYEGVKFPLYPQYKLAIFPYTSALEAKQLDIEIVHCHALATMGLASIFTAKTLRLPLVGTFHTMIPLTTHYITRNKKAQEVLSKAAWKAIKTFYNPFDVVTAPSAIIAKLLSEHGVENVKVVSNGVETQNFNQRAKAENVRKKLGVKKDDSMFLFVGRVTEEKNIDVVLKAFSQLNEETSKLAIVGDGPAFQQVKSLAKQLKLQNKVIFTGQVPHSEMPHYYAACDWQVTASTFETQGLGILEGMCCGKPCIGANSLAIPETIKNNYNGFLFEPFNVEECIDKMTTAINLNKTKYTSLSRNAALTGKKHSIQNTVTQWEKLYRSL
ncbi:MAG: glycosyltransferase [Candidatus Micrarchaeota archaeon]